MLRTINKKSMNAKEKYVSLLRQGYVVVIERKYTIILKK